MSFLRWMYWTPTIVLSVLYPLEAIFCVSFLVASLLVIHWILGDKR